MLYGQCAPDILLALATVVISVALTLIWSRLRFRRPGLTPVARDAIIEHMHAGMLALDAQNRIADLNPAAEQIIGVPASQAVGRPAAQVLSAWPDLMDHCRSVTETQAEIAMGQGEARRDYDLRCSPLTDPRGRPAGWLVILHDITARKQVEAALAQERNLLRVLIDNIPDHIYAKDTQSRFIIANLASARRMGRGSPDELIGKSDFDFVPRELAERFYADEQAIIQTGEPLINREEPLEKDADGRVTRWNLATQVPLRDSQGNIIGIVGLGREITDLKRAEEAIRQAELRYRSLFEEAPVMYVTTRDQEGAPIIADCNQTFLNTLGYTRAEVMGQPLANYYTPESRVMYLDN